MWTQSGKYIIQILAMIVAGCTTMGTGTGSTPSGGSPTVFSWESSDGVTGTMSATMAGGQTYRGQYFQITKNTTVDSIGPLWVGGWGGWGDYGGWGWGYWGADPSPAFITHYSGRVVANLAQPSGAHMRCQFRLAIPDEGMNGGGLGRCQLPDGTTIDASFPKS